MKWLIRGLYLSLFVVVVGGFFFLMYGEIPAPVATIEKVIPLDNFKHKQIAERSEKPVPVEKVEATVSLDGVQYKQSTE